MGTSAMSHVVIFMDLSASSWGGGGLELLTPLDFLCGSGGKESTYSVGNLGSVSGLGRSPGEGNGHVLQCSGL